jgi:hypothetical protein
MCVEHNEMNERELAEFERKLRFAMQHRAAPLGLKQRVLARTRERRQAQRKQGWILQRLTASVVLLAMVGGVAALRQVEERRKGEQAREQVLTALRITSKTLDRVNERLADDSR